MGGPRHLHVQAGSDDERDVYFPLGDDFGGPLAAENSWRARAFALGKWKKALIITLCFFVWLVSGALALIPLWINLAVDGAIEGVSVQLDAMVLYPSHKSDDMMRSVNDFTMQHAATSRIPGFLRAEVTVLPFEVTFAAHHCKAATLLLSTSATSGDFGHHSDAAGRPTLQFPALSLDVSSEHTAFGNVTCAVNVPAAAREAFRCLSQALFAAHGTVEMELEGRVAVQVRTRFTGTTTVAGVRFSKRVHVAGLGSFAKALATGIHVVAANGTSAIAHVPLTLFNPSPLGAVLGGAQFTIVSEVDGTAMGTATLLTTSQNTTTIHTGSRTGNSSGNQLVGSTTQNSPYFGPLSSSSPVDSGEVFVRPSGTSALKLEVNLVPGSTAGAAAVMQAFLAGQEVGIAATLTSLLPASPLSPALAGSVVRSAIAPGNAVQMTPTHAEVVGGTATAIIVNVTYTIVNPTGYVSGSLDAITLGVSFNGSLVGPSTVTAIPLARGNSTRWEVVSMSPEDLSVLPGIGTRYIEQLPFELTFAGLALPGSGPMTQFFTGWSGSLSVAGSPTPLVLSLEILKFGVTLDPPSYEVLAGATLLNPLPFNLTMDAISFEAFFNDTYGEPWARLPPESGISLGPVTQTGVSCTLPPNVPVLYTVLLQRNSVALAARLAEVYLVKNELNLDLDNGLVGVTWLNMSLPFTFKHYHVKR